MTAEAHVFLARRDPAHRLFVVCFRGSPDAEALRLTEVSSEIWGESEPMVPTVEDSYKVVTHQQGDVFFVVVQHNEGYPNSATEVYRVARAGDAGPYKAEVVAAVPDDATRVATLESEHDGVIRF